MFLRRKKSLLANFYFLQPNCTYFKAINQKCGTCIYLNIIILVNYWREMNYLFCSILFAVPKLRMESFLLSLLSGSGPIESYTLLYSSLLLGIRYCNYHLQDKNTLQEKHLGLQMQNAQEIRIRLSRCVSFSDHKCLRQKLKITFARCNFKPFDTQRCINDTLLTFYWKKIIINQNQLN